MKKYEPLYRLLAGRKSEVWTTTFSEIEDRVILAPLPKSARRYRQWWENGHDPGHAQSQAWLRAGWQTEKVGLLAEQVTFRRSAQDQQDLPDLDLDLAKET